MRILLVTWTDQLPRYLSILNPNLEYRAIVVDEVEPAKKILEKAGLSKTLIYPLYELKECVNDLYYDYVICSENFWYAMDLLNQAKEYGAQRDKLLSFCALNSGLSFLVDRSLRYFRKHAGEFEMFATGISYVEKCLDVTKFKRKLFNFGRGSQDLYYNFQVAKFVVTCARDYKNLHYALIGLAPYSFHYDQSKALNIQFLMLQYLIAFNDLHNFFVSVDDYRSIFHKEYLSMKLPTEPLEVNDPFIAKGDMKSMTPFERLRSRKVIDEWNEKYFPQSREENIKILDDYLTLCESNNIRPVMFLPPLTEAFFEHYNKQRFDEFYCLVERAIQKHPSAIFVDSRDISFLTDFDFYNVEHVNIQGAAKFSVFLNEFIEGMETKFF